MSNFPIFSVLGIEIEYMLVDKDSLNIQPKSDLILSALAGKLVNEVVLDEIALSNELVMHVLEFKNNGPKPFNAPIAEQFQNTILRLQPLLEHHNLLLLPTAAHPWMDPLQETKRWPHDNHAIYKQYDAIFNCQGHGWSNLQSMHLNLPYSNQAEFCHLHSVIRLILPLLPAIAASSPLLDGKATGLLDSRLYYYAQNQKKIPSISGEIIPEFIYSEEEYQQKILNPMYEDINPFDPEGILQHQWLNSRAAIPKFDYKAIEIRILDSQECVDADITIALTICSILQHWHNNSHYYIENPCDTSRLKKVFDQTIKNGLKVKIDDKEVLNQWQLPIKTMTIGEVWSQLIEKISGQLSQKQQLILELILSQGNLSERILRSLGNHFDNKMLKTQYSQLAHCLTANELFLP